MSLIEPPDDFNWDALEAELDVTTPDDIVDVSTLNDIELLDLERDLVLKLERRSEMLNVHTDEAREIHSLRAAARVELFRRGLK